MFRLLPGDPTTTVISPALEESTRQQLLESYGLAEPLWVQYGLFLKNMVTLNWGLSFASREPVFSILQYRLINTLVLMLPIMFLAITLGSMIGAMAAWYRDTPLDFGSLVFGFMSRSVPIFFGGMLFLIVFSYNLGWLPTGRMHSSTFQASGFVTTYLNRDFLKHLIGPLAVGTMYYMALPLLLMRNTMLEVLGDPFLQVLEAKGISQRAILFKHAARNSMLPVVTASSLMIGYAVGGQVLLETVYSWPGMGSAIVNAVHNNDYPVAQGAFLLMASLVVILNVVADILYAYLDPRVSYDEH
jgi:peptide/nickel transport system permease protein